MNSRRPSEHYYKYVRRSCLCYIVRTKKKQVCLAASWRTKNEKILVERKSNYRYLISV